MEDRKAYKPKDFARTETKTEPIHKGCYSAGSNQNLIQVKEAGVLRKKKPLESRDLGTNSVRTFFLFFLFVFLIFFVRVEKKDPGKKQCQQINLSVSVGFVRPCGAYHPSFLQLVL